MKDYKFGLKVLESPGNETPDFWVSRTADGKNPNEYNPYGTTYFNDPSYMVATGGEKITSIPSPYARMHVTDIAFREYTAGKGVMTEDDLKQKALSGDYIKSMSHCLDMFEIMYRLTDLDLLDHGITITINNMVTPNTPGLDEVCKNNPNLKRYIDTLQLFRNSYNNNIRKRVPAGRRFYYDFTQNYLFKYNGITFASTSPFSGFFTKADCNLINADGKAVLNLNGHNFLTNASSDWKLFANRDQSFLDFLYLLLNDTGLGKIYQNLFEALKLHVDSNSLGQKTFAEKFPNFNIGTNAEELPQVVTSDNNIYVRPNNIDRSYLKYLLFLEKPFDFSIDVEEFEKPIDDRLSPDGKRPMTWLSVNDLLSDSLVILPYDIDDKYEAIEYLDKETMHKYRRCLIPIKEKALNYIKLEKLIEGLSIKKHSNSHFSVKLTLNLTTGGKIELRRDYYSPTCEQGTCCYPNGVILQGNNMKQFVFGIYPFVKSNRFENIYKILFYNDIESPWKLDFFYEDNFNIVKYPNGQVNVNITNTVESGGTFYPHNCSYYEVGEGNNNINNDRISIKFAELSVDIDVLDKAGNKKTIKGCALIVPRLRPVDNDDNNDTIIAIDLGTTNTYMAYYHKSEVATASAKIEDFSTIHGKNNSRFLELEFMHKDIEKKEIPNLVQFYQDSILPTQNGNVDPEALSAQLSEFIPARIVRSQDNEDGFQFPIPSVINRLRSQNNNDGMSPLLNRSIPFAYYSIGWRRDDDNDKNIDNIAEGTFKWFYNNKNDSKVYKTDEQKKSDFIAFMSELLFIVRSNMLCNGYNLDNCYIIWTYPLSFQSELVTKYTEAWEVNFCKFFHPQWLDYQDPKKLKIKPQRRNDVKNYIKSTNESLTPFFACCDDPNAIHHLNLVIDMGGGSTDIIGYRNNQTEFITSFSFAGNALYLDGNLNNEDVSKEHNYIIRYLNAASETLKTSKSILERTRKIDIDAPVSSVMNYGFTQNPEDFEGIFANPVPKFMLQLHNAALFYHTAQVCQSIVPDEMPVNIYLTGNGSNLIKMTSNFNSALKYIRKSFEIAYNDSDDKNKSIEITQYPNPKAATVYGALKGDQLGTLSFNTDARNSRVVAFGDDKTFVRIPVEDDGIPASTLKGKEEQVYNNVLKFIDMFYNTYGNATPIMSKDDMVKCLDFIKGNSKNKVHGDFVSDSLFFQYISLLMEDVSRKLLKEE